MVPPEQARVFRRDGAYIITGGLGGLGLFLAEKMAAAGCGRIVLTSRSQPNPEAQETIERIRATGADIEVECGDIAEPDTAERLVAAATATGLPVRGVLHAAAVVEDATLTNITDELIDRDWAPKVYGAWNLHQRHGQPATGLVLLVLLGGRPAGLARVRAPTPRPTAGWTPSPAGAALRAFRPPRSRGERGARSGAARSWQKATGTTMITPDEGAYAFQALLRHDRAYTGYAPIIGTPWLTALAQRSPFAEVFQSTGQSRTDTSKFRAELNALPPDEWPTRLRRLISEQVSLILRRTIDPDRPLSDYGLDSLGNLELRTRIETETGIRITSTDITTVRGLAGLPVRQAGAPEPVSATS